MKQSPPDSLLQLRLYIHLLPVFGVPVSLWTLYGPGQTTAPQLERVSRLAVVIGMGWLLATVLLSSGAHSHVSHVATLRFWVGSSLVGSGYFLTNLWLMLQVTQGKTPKLPGLTPLSRRLPK